MARNISGELQRYRPTIQRWITSGTAANITRIVTKTYITQQVDLAGYLTTSVADKRYYQRGTVDALLKVIDADIDALQAASHERVHDITGGDHTAYNSAVGQVVQAGAGFVEFIDGSGTIEYTTGGDIDAVTPLLSWQFLSHSVLVDVGPDDHHDRATVGADLIIADQHITLGPDVALKDINNQFQTSQNVTGNVDAANDLIAGDDVSAGGNVTATVNVSAGAKLISGGDVEAGDDLKAADSILAGDPTFGSPRQTLDVRGQSVFDGIMEVANGKGEINLAAIESIPFEDKKFDLTGFQIGWDGRAKIRSLFAPTLSTIFFEKREVHAIGNTMIVATAGGLHSDFVVPSVALASGVIHVRHPQSGAAILFQRGEHLIMKTNAQSTAVGQINGGYPMQGPLVYMVPAGTDDGIGTPLETWFTVLDYALADDYSQYTVRMEFYEHAIASAQLVGYYDFRNVSTAAGVLQNRTRYGADLVSMGSGAIQFVGGDVIDLAGESGSLQFYESATDYTFDQGLVLANDFAFDTGIVPSADMTIVAKVRGLDPSTNEWVAGVKYPNNAASYGVGAGGSSGVGSFHNGEDHTATIGGGTDFDGVLAVIGSGQYGVDDTASANAFTGVDASSGQTIYLGARNRNGVATDHMAGVLEWVAIYDGALTSTEYAAIVQSMEFAIGDTLTATPGQFTYEENKAIVSFGGDDAGRVILDSNEHSAMVVVESTATPWVDTRLQMTVGEMTDSLHGGDMYGLQITDDPDNGIDGQITLTNTQRRFDNVPSSWGRGQELTTLAADSGLAMHREILTDDPYIVKVSTREDRTDQAADPFDVFSIGLQEIIGPSYASALQTVVRAHWRNAITLRDDDGNVIGRYNDEIAEGSDLVLQADGRSAPTFDNDGNVINEIVGHSARLHLEGGYSETLGSRIRLDASTLSGYFAQTISLGTGSGDVTLSAGRYLSLYAADTMALSAADLRMAQLPTSAPSQSGRLWNNNGVVNIVA